MADSTTELAEAGVVTTVLEKFSTNLARIARANEIPDSASGFRKENDAEHSFELALVAIAVADLIDPGLDRGLIARLALIHELEEVYCGDVSVFDSASRSETRALAKEAAGVQVLHDFDTLSPSISADFRTYMEMDCDEARFVYALDKILPFFHVSQNGRHHARPTFSEYQESCVVARRKVSKFPKLLPLFDQVSNDVGSRLASLNGDAVSDVS
ncbi:HD domain-containing protein [Nocardia sp. CA-107356]|uniref:HD domain-containing protein n=1 Tax=Nocardia sp. CA-107356 TaxID=3239972 RepID=UPI003D8BE300